MPVRRVEEQPEPLKGFEYGPGAYEWLEFVTDDGEVYAVAGITFDHPTEAWLYWRILHPGIKAWKDLRRKVVPFLQGLCRERGKRYAVVQTSDDNDVDFFKMVGYMEFVNRRTTRTAWQEV